MSRDFVLTTFLGVGLLAAFSGLGRERETWQDDETKAALFNDEMAVKSGSNVERVSASVDVEPTVQKWLRARQNAAGIQSRIQGLVVLTTTAMQAAAPTSVSGSGATTPTMCSATTASPPAGTASGCSANSQYDKSGASCSSSGGSVTATSCSANVAAPPAPSGGNNTTCSTIGSATASYCSASAPPPAGGGGGSASTCSTAGGQTVGGTSNGAVGCSATSTQNPTTGDLGSGSSCSTNGGAAGTTCSTYSGQHQSCSAGNTGTNGSGDPTTAFCSAAGGATDKSSTCSASAASNGTYGNTCTAIGAGNGVDGGKSQCSVSSGSTGSCSISSGNNVNGANVQCTTLPPQAGGTNSTLQCSAFGASGGLLPAGQGNCSVLNADGSLSSGPQAKEVPLNKPDGTPYVPPKTQTIYTCGKGYKGEFGNY